MIAVSLLHAGLCFLSLGLFGAIGVSGAGGASIGGWSLIVALFSLILFCPLALPVWVGGDGIGILFALPINSMLWGVAIVWVVRKMKMKHQNIKTEQPNP